MIRPTRGGRVAGSQNATGGGKERNTRIAVKNKPKPAAGTQQQPQQAQQPQQPQQSKPQPHSHTPIGSRPGNSVAYVNKGTDTRKSRKEKEAEEPKNIVLQPGLVLMREFLSREEQIQVQKQIWEMGRRDREAKEFGGFYRPYVNSDSEAKMNLQMMCLGKHWNPVKRIYEPTRSDHDNLPVYAIPENLREMCLRGVEAAQRLSSSEEEVPEMTPTACIVNLYTENGRLGMHRDKTETEVSRFKGVPVVSFSLGDTGDFIYEVPMGPGRAPQEKTVQLKSGDCLIFGGPSRMIRHSVSRIYPGSSPLPHIGGEDGPGAFSLRCGRLNLTFREDGWNTEQPLQD